MPTYEYECFKCGNSFELFQKITDAPRKRCPQCRGKVRRLLSGGVGLIFKGSGFYITDYKRRDTSKKEKPQDKSTSSPEKSKEQKTKNAKSSDK